MHHLLKGRAPCLIILDPDARPQTAEQMPRARIKRRAHILDLGIGWD
jgi:hypothetical protein